jgi:hypothetical protein
VVVMTRVQGMHDLTTQIKVVMGWFSVWTVLFLEMEGLLVPCWCRYASKAGLGGDLYQIVD